MSSLPGGTLVVDNASLKTPIEESVCSDSDLIQYFQPLIRNNANFVAGGCFKNYFSELLTKTSAPARDVDIFFRDKQQYDDTVDNFTRKYFKSYTFVSDTKNSTSFQQKSTISQESIILDLIKCNFGTPIEILNGFDFTVCQYALFQTDNVYKIAYHPLTTSDISNKCLRISEAYMLMLTSLSDCSQLARIVDKLFNRIVKYTRYGYKLDISSKVILFDSIRRMDQNYPITSVTETSY